MDKETANRLRELTARFYAEQAASFSDTRQAAWPGWQRVLAAWVPSAGGVSRVLDVACGNLRFLACVRNLFPEQPIFYIGVDSCDALMHLGADSVRSGNAGELLRRFETPALADGKTMASCGDDVLLKPADIVKALLDGQEPLADSGVSSDLTACFGFMHHVPGAQNRELLLRSLVGATRPGGMVALSFWRFADTPENEAKARETTERARAAGVAGIDFGQLDAGDYLRGWQGKPGAYRYCHSFDDAEIEALAQSVAADAEVIDRFRADGRDGLQNSYLVLRRR